MNIAWLDLETTGVNEHDESLLEVGVIVTDPDLAELDRATWLVDPDVAHVAAMAPVVRDMHTANGLLDEIDRHRAAYLAGRYPDSVVDPPATVDANLHRWLRGYAKGGQVALAGSGVGHFDARWLRHHLPNTTKLLTYWTLDVGVVRRFLNLAGAAPEPPEGDKAHRALDDAAAHLAEARHYLAMFRPLTGWAIGQRVHDGDEPGTVIRCHECGGSGQLHDRDVLPPIATPMDGAGQ